MEAIVDAIPEGASPIAPEPTIKIGGRQSFESVSDSEAAMTLNITLDELRALPNQLVIRTTDGATLTRIFYTQDGGYYTVIFGGTDLSKSLGRSITLNREDNLYTLIDQEV